MALRSGARWIPAVAGCGATPYLPPNNPVEAGHAARTFTVSAPSTASGDGGLRAKIRQSAFVQETQYSGRCTGSLRA